MVDPKLSAEEGFAWRIAAGTLVVAGVALGFGLLYVFFRTVLLLVLAIFLATALEPLIRRLRREGRSKLGAAVAVYGVLGLLAAVTAIVVVPLVIDQLAEALGTLPAAYRRLRTDLMASSSGAIAHLAASAPPSIRWPPDGPAEDALSTMAYLVGPLFRGLLATLALVVLAFYWSLQDLHALGRLLPLVRPGFRHGVLELLFQIRDKVRAYLVGQAILCLVVGAMALVAFLLIGLPYAIVLAIVYGLLEAIPYLGPLLGAATAIFAALTVDAGKALWVVLAAFVIQAVENYLLVPRVMDKSVGVNPVVTLLAIAAFGSLFGVFGAILAIPLAAIVQVILNRFLLGAGALEPTPPQGSDAASRLRYQARELIQDVRLQIRSKPAAPGPEADPIEDAIEAIAHELDDLLGRSAAGAPPVSAAAEPQAEVEQHGGGQ